MGPDHLFWEAENASTLGPELRTRLLEQPLKSLVDDDGVHLLHRVVLNPADDGDTLLLLLHHWACHGVDADVLTLQDQRAPLHYACVWGRVRCVRALLAAGAKPNLRDAFAATPLDYAFVNGAARSDHRECAILLLDHGARLELVKHRAPVWASDFVRGRRRCAGIGVLVLGLRKASPVMRRHGADAIRMVARAIWDTRSNAAWSGVVPGSLGDQ